MNIEQLNGGNVRVTLTQKEVKILDKLAALNEMHETTMLEKLLLPISPRRKDPEYTKLFSSNLVDRY